MWLFKRKERWRVSDAASLPPPHTVQAQLEVLTRSSDPQERASVLQHVQELAEEGGASSRDLLLSAGLTRAAVQCLVAPGGAATNDKQVLRAALPALTALCDGHPASSETVLASSTLKTLVGYLRCAATDPQLSQASLKLLATLHASSPGATSSALQQQSGIKLLLTLVVDCGRALDISESAHLNSNSNSNPNAAVLRADALPQRAHTSTPTRSAAHRGHASLNAGLNAAEQNGGLSSGSAILPRTSTGAAVTAAAATTAVGVRTPQRLRLPAGAAQEASGWSADAAAADATAGGGGGGAGSRFGFGGAGGGILQARRSPLGSLLPDASGGMAAQALRDLQLQALELLSSLVTTGGSAVVREAGKPAHISALLDLAAAESGDQRLMESSLSILSVLVAQAAGNRNNLVEADGVPKVIAVLRSYKLPWAIKSYAASILQSLCVSGGTCSAVVSAGALDAALETLEAQVAAVPSTARTSAIEDMLAVVAAVAADPTQRRLRLCESSRLRLLLASFKAGMVDFTGGGYRLATGVAQVLQHLAQEACMLPELSKGEVVGPLLQLVCRGLDYYRGVERQKDAVILTGAWCALGTLCKVWSTAPGGVDAALIATQAGLKPALELMARSGPVLHAIFVGHSAGDATSLPAGAGYLLSDSVVSDLKAATSSFLMMLLRLAGEMCGREELLATGASAAIKAAAAWPHAQWPAKRTLHLLGQAEMEYQPFVRYSSELLSRLLSQQGISAAPFLSRGVDAHLLLSLTDDYMRRNMGLDEVQVMKVRRLQRAHQMFNAMDGQDGKVDGCTSLADVKQYLESAANQRPSAASELASRVFQELQVVPPEPLCFLQFVKAYPWLSLELDAFLPTESAAGGRNGSKRQRLVGPTSAWEEQQPSNGSHSIILD